jgi:hypothetical protein
MRVESIIKMKSRQICARLNVLLCKNLGPRTRILPLSLLFVTTDNTFFSNTNKGLIGPKHEQEVGDIPAVGQSD